MRSRLCRTGWCAALAAVMLVLGPVWLFGNSAETDDEAGCKALSRINNLTIIEAALRTIPNSTTQYCYVRGRITPGITYHAQLPLPRNWNERFLKWGDGGTDGDLDFADHRVAQGYAVANSNMGHDSGTEPGHTYAWDNEQAEIDYGYRSVHVTVNAARTLIQAYYGKAPKYSYFEGCSTGGREALLEAQRFPYDFDGIVGGDPVNYHEENRAAHTWYMQRIYRNNFAGTLAFDTKHDGKFDSLTKLKILREKVLDKCDAIDGIKDGIIDYPPGCEFNADINLADKMCPGDVNGDDCFTKAQVQTIKDFYRGPYDSKGRQVYWGKSYGWEHDWAPRYIPWTGNNFKPSYLGTMDSMNYAFYEKDPGVTPPNLADWSYKLNKTSNPPEWAWWEFNIDDFTAGKGKKAIALTDDVDPNLTRYLLKKNGKFILYHGWADGGPAPMGSVQYFKDVVTTTFAGNEKAAKEHFRLFMAPGMNHCRGGPGPNDWDKLAPLVDWVENGKAPDFVVATHKSSGKVDNERPICAYPQRAEYTGPAGGQSDPANWVAKNFTCR